MKNVRSWFSPGISVLVADLEDKVVNILYNFSIRLYAYSRKRKTVSKAIAYMHHGFLVALVESFGGSTVRILIHWLHSSS